MPKHQIEIPDDINKQLKIYAVSNGRSLKEFLPRFIKKCVTQMKLLGLTIDEEGEIVPIQMSQTGYPSTFIPHDTPGGFPTIPIPENPTGYPVITTSVTGTAVSQAQTQEQTGDTQYIATTEGMPEGITGRRLIKKQVIEYEKPGKTLTPEEEQLKKDKLMLAQRKVREQRIKFLKEKCVEIYGYLMPYLENNDQKTIDFVLNKYPTDEDIIAYLERAKKEDDEYWAEQERIEQEKLAREPDNDYFKKIKRHYVSKLSQKDFDDLLHYVDMAFNDPNPDYREKGLFHIKEYEGLNIFDALDIPHLHTLTDEEWLELLGNLRLKEI